MLVLFVSTLSSCTAQKDSLVVKEGKEYYSVKVTPKLTLYSLSKKYKVPQEAIKAANGGLAEGLKTDTYVFIPVAPKEEKKEKREERVDEGLRNLDEIIKNEQDTFAPQLPKEKCPLPNGRHLSVGFILPFQLHLLDTVRARKNEYQDLQIPMATQVFLDFYEGSLIALDSLKKMGYHIDVFVYDDRGDTNVLKQIIERDEVSKLNLIIGPANIECFKIASEYLKKKNIYLISPFSKNADIVNEFANSVKIVPAKNSYLEAITKHALQNYKGAHFIVIGDREESRRNADFIEAKFAGEMVTVTKLYFEPGKLTLSVEAFLAKLSKEQINVVIYPSDNESFITKFLNSMSKHTKDYQFAVYGMEGWQEYASVDVTHFQELKVHIPSMYLSRYDSPYIDNMIYAYVHRFKTEPSQYAFLGFDLTAIFLKALNNNTSLDDSSFLNQKYRGMMQDYMFVKKSALSGFENTAVGMMEFKNYQLVWINE